MSDGDDFLARWSRRKLSARKPGLPKHDGAAHDAPPPAEDREVVPAGDALPHAAEPPGPLPRVEDLTAGSDLTAFLRDGVPEIVRKAALRRMWSLDPAIRDHVGLAECDWDFNRPESIPGFGPIGATVPVPDFFSRPTVADAAGAEAPAAPARPSEDAASPPRAADPDDAADALPPAAEAALSEAGAHAPEAGELPEATPAPTRRHGRALPRD